jgi:hypothetical protein
MNLVACRGVWGQLNLAPVCVCLPSWAACWARGSVAGPRAMAVRCEPVVILTADHNIDAACNS